MDLDSKLNHVLRNKNAGAEVHLNFKVVRLDVSFVALKSDADVSIE